MSNRRRQDPGLELLLDLDAESFALENGYWLKFAARLVPRTTQVPHGIRYSLTLHDRTNRRVLGYDNAHSVVTGDRGETRPDARDHKHYGSSVGTYVYRNAATLMKDFYTDVDRLLKRIGE